MSIGNRPTPPPFSSDLSSLVWPMSAEEFVGTAMQTKVLFQSGDAARLAELESPLGSYDLKYLLSHGDEATIWKQGGRETKRGTDDERDVEALMPGTTIQTHLMRKLAFGARFISRLARQMHLEDGFFSIFASQDSQTVTHYDRNYNFTIQLSGEKTWIVHTEEPAVAVPSGNMALNADRIARVSAHMHGVTLKEPDYQPSIYRLTPGDMLYVPPGYWHATECVGLSIQLNLSIEPKAWFQVLGEALIHHLEAQTDWRAPFGVPTHFEAIAYLAKLRQLVDDLTTEDIPGIVGAPAHIHVDFPVRRTLGSLLLWETSGAGVYFGSDELRFVARGTRGRWVDILKIDMEPALAILAKLDQPTTVREMSIVLQLDCERIHDFVQRLVDLGYLAAPNS